MEKPALNQKQITHELDDIHTRNLDRHISNMDVCQEIGSIAESNCHYTAGLTRRIEETGKTIEELTVGELLEIHRAYNAWFNDFYAR